MTKEQSIEILKCFKDNEIQRDKLEIDNRCGGWKIGRIYKALELNTAIETVLSMLEGKNREISKLKKHNDKLLKKLRNRIKEVKKLEKYSLYNEEFSRLNKQLQNKAQIIDLMTEYIEDELTVDEFCTKEGCYADNYIDGHCEKCLNCIKQYFENKAKELLNK